MHLPYYNKLAKFIHHPKPQWAILNGQTVGGLTEYCVDVFTTCNKLVIILQAGTVHLSFKTTVDDIKWTDSRKVKTRRVMAHMPSYRAKLSYRHQCPT